jgi:hypothetical protein
MKPTWAVFRAAMDYADVPEELERHNEELELDEDDDELVTLEAFQELISEYKQADDILEYQDDPTDVIIIEHVPTKTFWRGSFYHDSWNGTNYEEPYEGEGGPVRVELKEVLVEQWEEVEDAA